MRSSNPDSKGRRPRIGTKPPTMMDAQAVEETFYKWTKDNTAQLIRLRGENDHLFTGAKFSAAVGWTTILDKMNLLGRVSPLQAKKKWDNLKKKYKDCKYPASAEGVSGIPTAATWPWFDQMDEILGQQLSTSRPVVVASMPDATPGQSCSSGLPTRRVEEEDEEEKGIPARKKRRKNELLDLIREDMRLQREAEERRAAERRESFERLFSLLERMIEK